MENGVGDKQDQGAILDHLLFTTTAPVAPLPRLRFAC
jgi:hypothetical protein